MEQAYLDVLKQIMEKGVDRDDRTGREPARCLVSKCVSTWKTASLR